MNKTKLWLAIAAIAAVALLGIGLIMFTLFSINGGFNQEETKAPTTTGFYEGLGITTPGAQTTAPSTTPAPTEYVPGEGVLIKHGYVEAEDQTATHGDVVVAKVGDKELTNRQAQMYYWDQFYQFWNFMYNQYGAYAPYMIGLDFTQPFRDQPFMEGDMNWDQYLVESGVNTWHRYSVVGILAEQNGYTVDDEIRKQLDEIKVDMEANAKENGNANVDALIAEEMGPGMTMDDYLKYMEMNLLAQAYCNDVFEKIVVTDAEMEAYYTANQETLGVTKESGNVADVRHILIMPEGGTTVEGSAYKSYTEAEWAACLASAQSVLDEWKSGDATEESFIALTGKYTQDTGYATNGGLYTDVMKDSGYVESFEAWAADPARKPGDCELVKTEYGYHIMYLVNNDLAWVRVCRNGIKNQQWNEMIEEAIAKHPLEVDYEKIVISGPTFG